MKASTENETHAVGKRPEGWIVKRLGDICSVNRGGSPRPIQNYLTDDPDGINWIKIGDVGVGAKYIDTTEERITPDGVNRSRVVREGDFLISNSMSFGRPYILRTGGCIHDGWLVIQNYDAAFDREYLYYYLSSSAVVVQYKRLAAGSSVLNLNKQLVNTISVVIPPLEEQRAIAAALSDVDALLDGLDRLIDKKRGLKQAAMQQLLTGQTRLPGFHGEWEQKQLGEIVEIQKGQLITSDTIVPGDVPVIAGGKQPAYFHNAANRRGRTITISASGASAGYVALYSIPIFASDCSTISEGPNYSLDFIYFQLLMKQQLIYMNQTGGAQPHIHAVDLLPLAVQVPPLNEQTAIASVLSDMDAELVALEARRVKTRYLKQAMMQEVLTGRTRLVPPQATDA